MSRPNPIQYAERLYAAIRAANFSPLSFLAFGNAVKDGVELRRMPRIAAEPFMRVVGEMLDFEGTTDVTPQVSAMVDAVVSDERRVVETNSGEVNDPRTPSGTGGEGEGRP
jgi:hypothetical protein